MGISILLNYFISKASGVLLEVNTIANYFASNMDKATILYNNPLVLLQSFAYFCFFGTLSINSKIINKLSSLTIGVYLIHDNNYIRDYLYYWTKINRPNIVSYRFIGYALMITILIYIISLIIEWLRQVLFRWIYNRKISKKIRDKYYQWFDNIYIKRNSGGSI